ncbi:MAG: ABC transporter permease subunit [Chloroflexi bacterium]|nr:ABC transporter permease subunit [Chloroflexota bacterium]
MALASPPIGNGMGRGVRDWFAGLSDRYIYGGGAIIFLMLAWIGASLWGSNLEFPERFTFGKALAVRVDDLIFWITVNLAFILDPISDGILRFLVELEDFFQWVPWPVTIIAATAIAFKVAGRRMGIFALVSLLLLGGFGLWESAMETMALIAVAVLISIGLALPIGILAARSDLVDALIRPILDAMQTMPAFVYLVPAIMFLGIGNPAAVLATVIYAVPPAIRLTNLGIRQVSPGTVEAARAFGTTSRQLLVKVQIPMAIPTIMAGINQTTMMALAMVVIASLVGAGGLGDDVNRALSQFQPGNALNGGIGIVILAIIIDRVTQAAAKERQEALMGSRN